VSLSLLKELYANVEDVSKNGSLGKLAEKEREASHVAVQIRVGERGLELRPGLSIESFAAGLETLAFGNSRFKRPHFFVGKKVITIAKYVGFSKIIKTEHAFGFSVDLKRVRRNCTISMSSGGNSIRLL
jgi:hypothetical protein